ncbi:unnamed protein product [Allacma fusca]|uniref:Uncharacterized protein n=1 Tax=Allacma fusca TaxID=39272 RepID=A0A8J2JRI7_9HEXA|nr:unnamed protein product [Allacma fusca]
MTLDELKTSTRKILRPVFLTKSDLDILGLVSNEADNKIHPRFYNSRKHWTSVRPNYGKEPILGLVCVICIPEEDSMKKYEVEDFLITALSGLATYVNATLELESVMQALQSSHFQDGEWDGWVQPILDGTAAISTLLRPTAGFFPIAYLSRFGVFFTTGFLTGLPKRATFDGIFRLAHPFDTSIWIVMLTSILAVFITVAIMLFYESQALFHEKRRWAWESSEFKSTTNSINSYLSTVLAILQPILEQSVADKNIIKSRFGSIRCVVGCYQKMLEEEMACLGPTGVMAYFSPKFLTDIYRRPLSVVSKQTMFPNLVNSGVSKLYPNLIHPFNFVLGGLSNGGFGSYYQVMDTLKKEANGARFARERMSIQKAYAGTPDQFDSSRLVVGLATQLLQYGIWIALGCFALELFWQFMVYIKSLFTAGNEPRDLPATLLN